MVTDTPVRVEEPAPLRRRLSAALFRHPRVRLVGLLTLPATWLVLVYLSALLSLLVTAFFTVDEFTGAVVRELTLDNVREVLTTPAYVGAAVRTVAIAATVTVLCVLLGFPMAFFMAKIAPPRSRNLLVALVVTPLWASYLVKVYAWQAMVQPETGLIAWLLTPFGLPGPGFGVTATVLTLTYLWLPYMVLPVYAGLERMPDSLLDASGDLGARPARTVRSVVVPLVWPSIVVGSVFTFSLSLGDYITVQIVGGRTQMIGNIVYQTYTSNLPFAAAIALIPVAIMVVYLALVRRTGALDTL
ncbi:spermidine/putrescine ABC transporter permease [Cellulomonas chitinilytica]|uniref:Spermidine/putrescine ABC transporter permease n=1 Tax=Cellulomonas chitinilytica TaxID=398759 RepID=A0A919NYZ1_9CELL|nr:ABC transporter permease [Cellulomonas chitinilytica]GIG20238.1 spermidine/putrescine ABC transporter permease [Cellulomonas chitinilytica]